MFGRQRAVPGILLFLTIVGGSYVRVVHLGESGFRSDEIQHYHAARSLQEGLAPLNPAGREYRRGIDITRLVSVTDRLISPPEVAARLPAAAFGILNLLLMALAGWVIGGPWVAFWATLLLGIYPEAIWQSRQVRFYTYQLCFGLAALLAGWIAFRKWKEAPDRAPRASTWLWFAIPFVLLALATRVQIVSLSTMAGFATFLAVAGIVPAIRRRGPPWKWNVPLQITAGGLVLALAVLILRPGLAASFVERASAVPRWVGTANSPLTYYYALSGAFPVLIALAPVAAGVVLIRRPWLAAYLLCWFLVPFALHSGVFPFRQERFLLTAMPALFLLGSVAAVTASGAIYGFLDRRLETAPTRSAWNRFAPAVAVAVAAAAVIVTTPAFNVARKMPDRASWPEQRRENWRATVPFVTSIPADERVALGSSDPMSSFHYWGRIDFRVVSSGRAAGEIIGPAPAPVFANTADIATGLADYDRVLIAVDPTRVRDGRLEPGLLRALATEGEELCRGRCGSLSLYLWDHRSGAADASAGGPGIGGIASDTAR